MTKVYFAAIMYSIITGLSFLFGKVGLEYSDPMDLLAYRFAAAFAAIFIPVIFKLVDVNINKSMIKRILPMTLFYPLGFFGFQLFGLKYTPSSEAGIFLAVGPVFTMILAAYFLKEKTSFLQKISILLSVTGVIYITISKGFSLDFDNMKGIIFLLISVLCFAIYSVMARKLTKDYTSMELSYIMIIVSFIAFNTISIFSHTIKGSLGSFLAPLSNLNFIISVLYLGVLSSSGTSFLSNYVLSNMESSKMSVFSNLATVISIVAGVIFLKEDIFYYHVIGSILIIIGVIGTNIFGIKEKELD